MKTNVGKIDKNFRITAGIIIIAMGVLFQSWWGAAGLILLATGLTAWCPLYSLFGISTCNVKQAK